MTGLALISPRACVIVQKTTCDKTYRASLSLRYGTHVLAAIDAQSLKTNIHLLHDDLKSNMQ